jgi:hypothetical protein
MGGGPSKECPPGKTVYTPGPPGKTVYTPGPPGKTVYTPGPPGKTVYTPGPPGKTVYTPSAYLGIGYNAVDNNSKQMLTALQKVFAQTQINVCNEASQQLINEIAKMATLPDDGPLNTNDAIKNIRINSRA